MNLFEIQEKEPLCKIDDWDDLEFEVALDSGAFVHVCGPGDCPGYSLEESPGSRSNLFDEAISKPIARFFEIAAVSMPLMSVGRVCDEGTT